MPMSRHRDDNHDLDIFGELPRGFPNVVGWCHHCYTYQWGWHAVGPGFECVTDGCDESWLFGIWCQRGNRASAFGRLVGDLATAQVSVYAVADPEE